jgi:hypothetical protein
LRSEHSSSPQHTGALSHQLDATEAFAVLEYAAVSARETDVDLAGGPEHADSYVAVGGDLFDRLT